MEPITKAYAITNARISFVSLVDKAANKRTFLLTKAEGGQATFETCGRIVKADAESHYVTGIVYEPMTEDTDGNYMTEAEIEKACHWFAKNGDKVDLQHSFEPMAGAAVVENWIAKSDTEINGQPVQKGTWLMTVEVTDPAVWEGIQKGEITGFSMGGIGNYSEEDVDLKAKKSLLKRMAEYLGIGAVEKSKTEDEFARHEPVRQFWDAVDALEESLWPWDPNAGTYALTDPAKIREELEGFSTIIQTVLAGGEPVLRSVAESRPVRKEGRKMSGANLKELQGIHDSLGAFLDSFKGEEAPEKSEEEEPAKDEETGEEAKESGGDDNDVKKEEKTMTDEEKAVEKAAPETEEKLDITPDLIQKMVDEAVKKATAPAEEEKPETITKADLEAMIQKAVEEKLAPVLKSRGVPSNLNNEAGTEVKKEEEHFLHGIL